MTDQREKTCFVVSRNKRTKKSRVCGKPVGPNGRTCARHEFVVAAIDHFHQSGVAALSEPKPDQEDE